MHKEKTLEGTEPSVFVQSKANQKITYTFSDTLNQGDIKKIVLKTTENIDPYECEITSEKIKDNKIECVYSIESTIQIQTLSIYIINACNKEIDTQKLPQLR